METPTLQEIIQVIQELNIPKYAYNKEYEAEKSVEKAVSKQLEEIYGKENVTQQYSVGGFLALKCDIDLFDKQCGIELKLAKSLTATIMQRVIGQVIYYSNRCYHDTGLILLVVGKEKEYDSKMKELGKFINDLHNIHFVYKSID